MPIASTQTEEFIKTSKILKYGTEYCVCLFTLIRAPTRTIEQWNMVGSRIKIMWEEQLVDPPNEYITPVNVP